MKSIHEKEMKYLLPKILIETRSLQLNHLISTKSKGNIKLTMKAQMIIEIKRGRIFMRGSRTTEETIIT